MKEQALVEAAVRATGVSELARILGVDRHTVGRWIRRAPSWLLFALLGVAVSRGDRLRAVEQLTRATFLVDTGE
jgi:hypothetical protein